MSDHLLTILEFQERFLMAEQLTPVLTSGPKRLLKIERRAWLRFPSERDIICKPPIRPPRGEPEVAWLGNVRDVSVAGIGLSMSRRFEPGAELIVEVFAGVDGTVNFPVCVIHATPEEKGRWIIGCEFVFPLSEKELQNFLADDSENVASKRRWFRSKK
jgi:PilZ domain